MDLLENCRTGRLIHSLACTVYLKFIFLKVYEVQQIMSAGAEGGI
jgi:hypothetical protein